MARVSVSVVSKIKQSCHLVHFFSQQKSVWDNKAVVTFVHYSILSQDVSSPKNVHGQMTFYFASGISFISLNVGYNTVCRPTCKVNACLLLLITAVEWTEESIRICFTHSLKRKYRKSVTDNQTMKTLNTKTFLWVSWNLHGLPRTLPRAPRCPQACTWRSLACCRPTYPPLCASDVERH
jgi:hypothetical protein